MLEQTRAQIKKVAKIEKAFNKLEAEGKQLLIEAERLNKVCNGFDSLNKKLIKERDEILELLTSVMEKCDLDLSDEQKYLEIATILGKVKGA